MKKLIVQGICRDNVSDWEWKNFWSPAMASVRKWAEKRGHDYKLFLEPTGDDWNADEWFPEAKLGYFKNVYYKFQWMKGWDEYDQVYWLDSDILIWGDPDLPQEEDLFFMKTNRPLIMDRWIHPNMSIWGGLQSRVSHFVSWADDVFHYRKTEPALLTCFKELTKAGIIPQLTEERFAAVYVEEFKQKNWVMIYDYYDNLFAQNFRPTEESGIWKPDTFYHLGGENKVAKLQRMLSFITYVQSSAKFKPWEIE